MEENTEAHYIRSSSEQTGWLSLIFEILKTIIDVNLIIIWSIFRFIVPAGKKDLRGEVVLITGAAGFVGKRLALRFAEKGIFVSYLGAFLSGNNRHTRI